MSSHKTCWALIVMFLFCAMLPFIIIWIWHVETLASTPSGPTSSQSQPAAK
jgi:hypothetical protein